MSPFFILSGLFLGWSLGANDAANIFGTAVKTKMVSFRKAAILASIFVVIGSVVSGKGTSLTLVKLGSINAIGGAFTVALCAGITVAWMTKLGLPVSTTQAIIGGIIGWNLFTGSLIEGKELKNIILSWFSSPLLTAIFSFLLFKFLRYFFSKAKLHLLTVDNILREGLIFAGIIGAYTLGANNIANVIGIFIPNFPLREIFIGRFFSIKSDEILLFLGGLSIALGIITYSRRVIDTVGSDIFKLSPLSAFVVVLSESLVLFLFSSKTISNILGFCHLPKIPLVPVSSSHCVVGGVIGIGLAKGVKGMNIKTISKIVFGWVFSPLFTMILTFFLLFFVQNVFKIEVSKVTNYSINGDYIKRLKDEVNIDNLKNIKDKTYNNAYELYRDLKISGIEKKKIKEIIEGARIENIYIEPQKMENFILNQKLKNEQIQRLRDMKGKKFVYRWEIRDYLNRIWDLKKESNKIDDFINYFKN